MADGVRALLVDNADVEAARAAKDTKEQQPALASRLRA
jgi:hypothetical protein